ncbi:MAG: SnoaL-like domain-containing protein [Planctomycetota bacterium]
MPPTAAETKAVADRIVELCKQGQHRTAVEECYADNIVSVEATSTPDAPMPREMTGKEMVLGKTDWWYDNHEMHGGTVDGPFMHGDDRFALIFDFDVTFKPTSQRMQMREVGLYTVADGKISREEFYYTM